MFFSFSSQITDCGLIGSPLDHHFSGVHTEILSQVSHLWGWLVHYRIFCSIPSLAHQMPRTCPLPPGYNTPKNVSRLHQMSPRQQNWPLLRTTSLKKRMEYSVPKYTCEILSVLNCWRRDGIQRKYDSSLTFTAPTALFQLLFLLNSRLHKGRNNMSLIHCCSPRTH